MKHKMAIIGFGGMGQWHYENVRDRIDCFEVKGIYDTNPIRTEVAAKFGLKIYESSEEIAKDNEMDLVLIATPNHYHKSYSVEMLNAGKNVLCEKPVCLNIEELDEISNAQVRSKKLFTVHHNRRWDIDYQIAKLVIEKDLVGKPYFIDSRLFGSKGLPGDWRADKTAGGGMLYDWAVHLIDQILMMVKSRPESVYAVMKNIMFKEVDDCNKILINFENGVNAQIVVDSWCYIGEPRWHISGDDGTAIVENWFQDTGKIIKANIKEIDWEEGLILTPNGRTRTLAPRPKTNITEIALPVPEPHLMRWEGFYENLAAVIEGNAEPIVTMEQIRLTTKIIDACMKSAETKTVVKLN